MAEGPGSELAPSLSLAFALEPGKVRLDARPGLADELGWLAGGFASATRVSLNSIEVGLDDLLLNIGALLRWPTEHQQSVRWHEDLRRLAEGNVLDAAAVASALTTAPNPDTIVLPNLGSDWNADLTPFQSRDLLKLVSLKHSANFSVPGAGKTRVALAVLQSGRMAGQLERALVVCPKSAFEAWRDENLLTFGTRPLRMRTVDSHVLPECDVLLVNYERLPDLVPAAIRWLREKPALLVLDEAHRMKLGPAGAWGAACMAIGPYAARRLVLTGTPAPNGSKDLENVLGFVWPGQGQQHVRASLASGDLKEASARLRPLYARTKKFELGLPPISVSVRRLELPPIHREIYQALLGDVATRVRGQQDDISALGRVVLYLLMAATSPALLAAGASRYEPLAYRIPPLEVPFGSPLADLMRDLPAFEMSPKFTEAAAIIKANAYEGRKTLVWSTFVRNLTTLERLLSPFQPALVHGGTIDRQDQLDRFRNDPACYVLLSNPATLGEGISLHQQCHDAIYVDRDFAAGRFLQSLDRIHRLGLPATTETNVTILVSSQTVDEVVEGRLAAKLRFMGSVLDDEALLELADLDEEPSEGAGLNDADRITLLEHLRVGPTR